MSESKTIRVEVETDDGTIRRLTGFEAKRWEEGVGGVCMSAYLHGITMPQDLAWEEFRRKGSPSEEKPIHVTPDVKAAQREAIKLLSEALEDAHSFIKGLRSVRHNETAVGIVKSVREADFDGVSDKIVKALTLTYGARHGLGEMISFGQPQA